MVNVTYDTQLTALLVIDPYNDFIAEGGKVWDRLQAAAEANRCVPHMVQVLHAARQAGLRVFYALGIYWVTSAIGSWPASRDAKSASPLWPVHWWFSHVTVRTGVAPCDGTEDANTPYAVLRRNPHDLFALARQNLFDSHVHIVGSSASYKNRGYLRGFASCISS